MILSVVRFVAHSKLVHRFVVDLLSINIILVLRPRRHCSDSTMAINFECVVYRSFVVLGIRRYQCFFPPKRTMPIYTTALLHQSAFSKVPVNSHNPVPTVFIRRPVVLDRKSKR